MNKSRFKNNIIRIRKFHGWSQDQAAIRIGIKRCTLASYEEGRAEPSFDVLFKIADTYCINNIYALLYSDDFLTTRGSSNIIQGSLIEKAYKRLKGKEKKIVDILLATQ